MRKTILLVVCAVALTMPSCAGKNRQNAADDTRQQTQTAAVAKKKHTVRTLPLAVTDNILKKIEENYKGKVVFIDLWATWCGPCRMAMTVVDSIKPQMVKKGVKFVYVTGESSPLATWNSMIPNISGDHYRLSGKQWNKMCQELGVRGIPCYKIVNKDGTTAFSNLTSGGYPGNAVMKTELEKALKRKK